MSSSHIRHSEFPEHMLLVIDTSYKYDFYRVFPKLNSFLGKFLFEACHLTKNKLLQKFFSRILYKFQAICYKSLIYLTVSICWNTFLLLLSFLLLTQIISPVLYSQEPDTRSFNLLTSTGNFLIKPPTVCV